MAIDPLLSQTSYAALAHRLDGFWANAAGRVRNEGDVRQIGGFSIDVAGKAAYAVSRQDVQAGLGVKTFTPQAGGALLAPETAAALQQMQMDGFTPDALAAVRNRSIEGTPYDGMAIAGEVEIRHTPVAPEQAEGLGWLPGEVLTHPGGEVAYQRQQVARIGELAKIEADLEKEFGGPVKLAFDPVGGDYLMLRPGDPGYDEVKSARQVLARTGYDAQLMGRAAELREVLGHYGIKV